MKTLIRSARVALLLLVVLAAAGVANAQTTLTSTTLSSAITNASDQSMIIASATGWTASTSSAQTFALIDREVVGVRAVSGTTVTITRGQSATRGTGHPSGTKVWFIPAGSVTLTGFDRAGACSTAGSADQTQNGLTLPLLNTVNGRTFSCLGSVWVEGAHLGNTTCAVTQATNRTTGVTCAGTSGAITTNSTSLAAEAAAEFTVTDTAVALGDTVVVSQRSGANGGNTNAYVSAVTAGTFKVTVANNNAAAGTAETGAIILNFVVVKAAP